MELKSFVSFSIFSWTIKFSFKLFCLFVYDKILSTVQFVKNYKNFLRYTIFRITYMCSTSVFTNIMTMFPDFYNNFYQYCFYFQTFYCKCDIWIFFLFRNDSYSLLVNSIIFFSKLIIFIYLDSQNFSIQSTPLYTSCLFSVPSNVHIIDTEYPQGMCSPIFVVVNFSGLFFHPSTFLIKESRSV